MHNSLLHGGGGHGGAMVSGGSVTSTLSSQENNMVISSEESSSFPDDSELELGLGLSLGGGGMTKSSVGSWDQYAKILTAKDLPSVVSTKTSSSTSSSSSVTRVNTSVSSGTKRTAESPCSPPGRPAINQVVGWPPVRTYRMNSFMNHAKSAATEEFFSTADKCKSNSRASDRTNHGGSTNKNTAEEKGLLKTSLFVKVNMDGIPIGRKVDLNAHSSYETLAHALDDMFTPNAAAAAAARRSNVKGQAGKRRPVRLLDGSSDFVLTYEDKEGDWMLVGDVPWEIFLNSMKRLRIMRTTDANGLAPGSQDMNSVAHT